MYDVATTSDSLLFFTLFFFNDPATTEIYTLSYTTLFRSLRANRESVLQPRCAVAPCVIACHDLRRARDRKSTRLNSSHVSISYAVFCLKKKKARSLPRPSGLSFAEPSARPAPCPVRCRSA